MHHLCHRSRSQSRSLTLVPPSSPVPGWPSLDPAGRVGMAAAHRISRGSLRLPVSASVLISSIVCCLSSSLPSLPFGRSRNRARLLMMISRCPRLSCNSAAIRLRSPSCEAISSRENACCAACPSSDAQSMMPDSPRSQSATPEGSARQTTSADRTVGLPSPISCCPERWLRRRCYGQRRERRNRREADASSTPCAVGRRPAMSSSIPSSL